MNRRLSALVLSVLVLCAAAANAQNVFVLPASFGSSSSVSVFGANPFFAAGAFAANSSASVVLSTGDGLKYYVISSSSTNTVQAVDNNFSTVRNIASLPQPATAAIMSPDGRRLIVGASAIQIYDTATDAPLVPNGIAVSGTVIDLAVSLDSTRLFALVNTGAGTSMKVVDLATYATVATVTIPGFATGVSAGPNGLLYITTQNQFLEMDPRTAAIRQSIIFNGLAGKMVFTPDGRLGLSVNKTPITGAALFSLDLTARTLGVTLPISSVPANATLDQLFPVGTNRVLALSNNSQTIFDITLNPLSLNSFISSSVGAVSAAGITSDIATPNHSGTQYLFLASNNNLFRVDLSANQIAGQLPVNTSAGGIAVAGAAATGTPATMLTFGDHQAVLLTAATLPLVVRLTDAQGRPLAGVPVNFSTNGGTLQASNVTTNIDGFAETTLIAPNAGGAFTVTATAGNLSANFTVNVGNSSGGVTGGLTIIAGQGQLLPEQDSSNFAGTPMIVLFSGIDGKPVPNAPITFTITSGSGTVTGGVSTDPFSTVVDTDDKGLASVAFLTDIVTQFPGILLTTVNATSADGALATFYATTYSKGMPPGAQLQKPNLGTVLTGQAGQTLKGAVQALIYTSFGTTIPNVALQLVDPANCQTSDFGVVTCDTTKPSPAVCAGTFALSNAQGIASCDVVLGAKLGLIQVLPLVGDTALLRAVTINVLPGPPSIVQVVQGDKQSGRPGDKLPLTLLVQVTDSAGNSLPGTAVSWMVVTPGSATLSNVVNTTDSLGRASAQVTLGNIAGTYQITATAGGVTQTFLFTVQIPAAGLQYVSGNSQTALINTAFAAPLVVRVVDAQGNGFGGAQVTFVVTGGVAFIQNASPVTDAQGNASTGTITAGGTAGPVTIGATFGNFGVVFNLTARLAGPNNITLVNGASFVANTTANNPGNPCAAPGCVSPGEIVTINGSGMLPGVQGVVAGVNLLGQLPTSLSNGFSVLFNGISAPIFYVANVAGKESATVQVPFELQNGAANVTINAVGGATATVVVQVQPFAPGIFTTGTAQNLAVAVRSDGSYVNPGNPAARGETIVAFLTGLGQTTPPTGTNRVGAAGQAVNAQLVVGVNNSGVQVIKTEYAPGLVGVYVVTFVVPIGTLQGPAQPLSVGVFDSLNNQYFSQTAFLPIQ
jgi:uncharacterized protein (TIGR03437 family)